MDFEVRQPVDGSRWLRRKNAGEPGASGDTRVLQVNSLEELLLLVEGHGSVRILPPREGRTPALFELQFGR